MAKFCIFHRWAEMFDSLTYHWNGRLDTWIGCTKCGRVKRGTKRYGVKDERTRPGGE